MPRTYSRMLAEHVEIEEVAAQFLDAVGATERDSSSQLYARLSILAALVEQHVLAEEELVTDMTRLHLKAPWIAVWKDGATKFEKLKADWLAFFDHWQQGTIEAHRHEFRLSARVMIRGLSERLAWETEGFYATALQAGAIVLRK